MVLGLVSIGFAIFWYYLHNHDTFNSALVFEKAKPVALATEEAEVAEVVENLTDETTETQNESVNEEQETTTETSEIE